jgi:DNA-binding CsgD family transcriptional regulator/PAS domain-containing protein
MNPFSFKISQNQAFAFKDDISINQESIYRKLTKYRHTWDLIINSSGIIAYCSPNCIDITGYPSAFFLKNYGQIESIIHQKDKESCLSNFISHHSDDKTNRKEYRIIDIEGKVKWITSVIKPIKLETGHYFGNIISNLEITAYQVKLNKYKKLNSILRNRIEELVRELSGVYYNIDNSENKLLFRNQQLEKMNKELLATHKALKVLANNLCRVKKNTENELLNIILKNIYPFVTQLKEVKNRSEQSRIFDLLSFKLNELCQSLDRRNNNLLKKSLSATELKIASYIKDGLRSKDIAKKLKISVTTVKTHRKNIRRKFNIQNSHINMVNYLNQKWPNEIK